MQFFGRRNIFNDNQIWEVCYCVKIDMGVGVTFQIFLLDKSLHKTPFHAAC